MAQAEKILIFLCSGAAKAGNKKLSYRIATRLEVMGIAEIGGLETLSDQRALPAALQKRMLFINDCRSGCVNILTHGFEKDKYLFVDASAYTHSPSFDIEDFIQSEVLLKVKDKWQYA